jgi:hypothetical protein
MTPRSLAGATEMHHSSSSFWPQRAARLSGLLYLVIIVCGVFAELVVRERYLVAGDAVATADNILAHESQFRWGFAADLVAGLCVVPLIYLLYEILKDANRHVARTAIFFSLVGMAVQSSALLGHFAPLVLLKRGAELGVPIDLLRAHTYMALQLQSIGYAVALAFFGGTMLCRGYLIVRGAVVPRAIGVALMVEGVAYWANSFVDFVAPGVARSALQILMVSGLAEVALCLSLLVMGVNVQRWQALRASTGRPRHPPAEARR